VWTRSVVVDDVLAHDAASRLTLLEHKAGATTLGRFAYTLNARGDRAQAYEILARAGGGQDDHTLVYGYDGAQRVPSAIRYPGTPQRSDTYSYDVASNRLSQAVALNGGAPTSTNYTYDDANRLSSAGFAYDNAGRMTSDGTNTYTWDRGNRLRTVGSTSYTYDGDGRRISQTVNGVTTNYLLDMSMGLWETLTATTGANVTRYVHSPSGLLAQHDGTNWDWMLADGLGSVRNVVDGSANVLWSSHYAPYGSPFGGTGSAQTAYGYTGEPTDGNGLVYLRNRYYAPGLGMFASVDPLETANRYAYVGGNVVNATDPSGLLFSAGSGLGVKKSAPTSPKPPKVRTPVTKTPQIAVSTPVAAVKTPQTAVGTSSVGVKTPQLIVDSGTPKTTQHGGNSGSPTDTSVTREKKDSQQQDGQQVYYQAMPSQQEILDAIRALNEGFCYRGCICDDAENIPDPDPDDIDLYP
jgi:RHS repeat-associated protein